MPGFDVKPLVYYLAESKADLAQLQVLLAELHESFYGRNVRHGGSIEYWEAHFVLGKRNMGLEYLSPRENFEKKDQLVVTAEDIDGNSSRVIVTLAFEAGETKEEATKRWVAAGRAQIVVAAQFAGLPLLVA